MTIDIQTITNSKTKRMLVTSDVHGNLKALKTLLQIANFKQPDCLLIIGDICEKGEDSLGLLRFLIALKEQHEVYVTMGNCDTLYEDIFDSALDTEKHNTRLIAYMQHRYHCLFNEMTRELGLMIPTLDTIKEWKEQLKLQYHEEFSFLKDLPHIIESESYIFVHAALMNETLSLNKPSEVLETAQFLNVVEQQFTKTVVVGHWPVSLYHHNIIDYTPIYDKEHNVLSIDGGNVIKDSGQLNGILIENQNIHYIAVDDLPYVLALEDQIASKDSVAITYLDAEVLVLDTKDSLCYCEHQSSNLKFWIPKSLLYVRDEKTYTDDYTNYVLPVKAGEKLHVIAESSAGLYAKKNGICGWYYNAYEKRS